jgi:general secretion pathway protein G
MSNPFAGSSRGFSLLELVVIAALLLLLLAIALVRYAGMQAVAEQSDKNAVLESLRVALALKATELAMREGASRVGMLEQVNPFNLQGAKLANYGGEIRQPRDLAPATWYYSAETRELLYVERWAEGSLPILGSPLMHHYRVVVRFGAGGADGVIVKYERSTRR